MKDGCVFVCSAKQTQVIDDEADYFATDSNQWLTSQQRAALRSRESELHSKRHASRRDRGRQVTLDFAGRRVVEEPDSEMFVADVDVENLDSGEQPQPEFNPEDFSVDLVNRDIRLPAAPQVRFCCK